MKKCEKEYFYSSTWNIVFYVKSLIRSHQNCLYAFVCFTNWNFLSCKLFNKKNHYMIVLTSVFIAAQICIQNKVPCKQ